MTINGVLYIFITIVFVAVLSPLLFSFIGMYAGNATANGDTTSAAIANILPTMLMVGVLVGIVIYSIAGRAQKEEG